MLNRVRGWLHREPKAIIPKTILIVDNNTNDRRTTAGCVVQLGYQAIEAGTVAKALQQLEEHDPDCVLLAFDLPDGKGTAVVTEIARRDII